MIVAVIIGLESTTFVRVRVTRYENRTVWLLPIGSDCRWLEERTDSPWYPTMQLFGQKAFGDWTGVF